MKSLIPVLLTISITLTLKGYFSTDFFDENPVGNISQTSSQTFSIQPDAINVSLEFPKTFELQLVKTAIIPFENSVDFGNPHVLSNYPIGAVNWISSEGINATLPPSKIQFFTSGNPLIHGINWQEVNKPTGANHLLLNNVIGHPFSAQKLPSNSVISYQTADGSYYILRIKQISWGKSRAVELSVYHAS